MVLEHKVVRKIFGSKEQKLTRECRKLHDKKLLNLLSLTVPGIKTVKDAHIIKAYTNNFMEILRRTTTTGTMVNSTNHEPPQFFRLI
jgi:hypothetical protein